MRRRVSESIAEVTDRYRGLSPAAQRAVWALLAVEAVLIAAAQVDIQRQPADRVRGPKLLWRIVATQNLIGPAAYFGLARKG